MTEKKRLWAPWRMSYINDNNKSDACIFCAQDFPAEEDRKRLILHRGEKAFVLMNLYPYNPAHLMVAPYKHTGNICELSGEEFAEIHRLTQFCVETLTGQCKPEGFNIGINMGKCAGAGFAGHIHQHIVPRWNGDTNFMPVLSEVRAVPEHIQATYENLLPFFEKLKR